MKRPVGLIPVMILLAFTLVTGCQKSQPEEPALLGIDFTATPTSGTPPLTVQFTDQSSGKISERWWFFGDGQVSREQNPSHTYAGDGIYTVSLVVTGSDEPLTVTKEDYVLVGSQTPLWKLRGTEYSTWETDIPPHGKLTLLDIAGQGMLYWTEFSVKDKDETEWEIVSQYEHSILVDGYECYGALDRVGEIWGFQNAEPRRPDAFYPAITSIGKTTLTSAFWRVNIPFNDSLAFYPENNDYWGTVRALKLSLYYGIVGSGVPGEGQKPELGEEFTLKKVNEELGFPAAPKIKAALEDHFGKKVFSVSIISWFSPTAKQYAKVLYVDAPEISRTEIRNFLVREGFIELGYEIAWLEFAATPTSGSVPLTVQFTNLSLGDVSGWLWSFGDGQTSTEENPSHTYTADGVYTVSLTTTSKSLGRITETMEDYIGVGR